MSDTKMEFLTVEGQHWYYSPTLKDVLYPSVTTILSVYPKGVGFAKYLANQESWESSQAILTKAGDRGTKVHKATERLEDGEVLVNEEFASDEWIMLQGFIDWHRKYNPKLILKEVSAVSDELKTGGTVDRVYEIDGVRTIIDIKTSNKIHDSYWVQVAVYAKMFEDKGIPIENVAVLRLRTLGKEKFEYQVIGKDQWHQEFELFAPLQTIWNKVNPDVKPRIVEVPLTLQLHEVPEQAEIHSGEGAPEAIPKKKRRDTKKVRG